MTPHHRARKTRLTAPAALTMGALLGLSLSQLIEGQATGIIATLLMTGLLLAAPNALRLTHDKPGTGGLGVTSAASGAFFALATQAQNEPQLITLGLGLGCAALSLWMTARAKRSRAGLRNGHHASEPKAADVPAQPSLTQGAEQWGMPADTSAAPRPKSAPKAEKMAQLTGRRSQEPRSQESRSQESLNRERHDEERRRQEQYEQKRRDRQAEEQAIQAEQERRRQQEMAWAAINWNVGLTPTSREHATERQDHRQESCNTTPRHDSARYDSARHDSARYDSCTDDSRSRSSLNDTGSSANTDSGSSSSDSGSSSSPSFE